MKAFIFSSSAQKTKYPAMSKKLKGVSDMIAEQKILGGECSILPAFQTEQENNYDTLSVNELIMSCPQSKESLSRLYVMFKESVFSIGFSVTSDYHLAEDCVAETFVRLTQVRNFNPDRGDGRGFIFTVARNVAMEIRRKYKKSCNNPVIQSYGEADKTVEDSIFINQLLKELNDKQRQIVVMKVCLDLTFKEIAKIMKTPESTVKSRYARAIAILKKKAGADSEK